MKQTKELALFTNSRQMVHYWKLFAQHVDLNTGVDGKPFIHLAFQFADDDVKTLIPILELVQSSEFFLF